MDPRSRNDRTAGLPRDEDHEIAADAAAMGAAEISRSTGTGSAGSGLAASGDRGIGRTSPAATTGATTDAEDVGDAVDPSSALSGGTGIAGSGLGRASVAGAPSAGAETGATDRPGAAAEKDTTRGAGGARGT